VQIQLLQDMGAVRVHRVQAETQCIRNLLVGFSFGHQLQDLALAVRQQLIAVVSPLLPKACT